jgi:hypothetical protein
MNPQNSTPPTPREVELAANSIGYALEQVIQKTISSIEALAIARHLYDQGLLKMLEIPPSNGEDPLFPVVITKTVERVVWVRACAEDHATDIVSENAEAHFRRGSRYADKLFQVRSTTPEMVPPSM